MAEGADIQLVVFDLAGTIIDFGCFGPVTPFVRVFAQQGVQASPEEARVPMGLHKRDHILAMARSPRIAAQWQERKGRDFNDDDLDRMYREFIPLQLSEIRQNSRLIAGFAQCAEELRRRGIKIATTTGYFREAAALVHEELQRQGFVADHNACADDVPAGRPAPWMIFHCMQALGVYPPRAVVNVGDTTPDILSGINAGCISVGVVESSSLVGRTTEELAALDAAKRERELADAAGVLEQAGAHAVIPTVAALADRLDSLRQNAR
jgi:phosphonoacetaldehyde hydrolase